MTHSEIKLLVFVLATLLIGAIVKSHHQQQPPQPLAKPSPKPQWQKPPYIFKTQKEIEKLRQNKADP